MLVILVVVILNAIFQLIVRIIIMIKYTPNQKSKQTAIRLWHTQAHTRTDTTSTDTIRNRSWVTGTTVMHATEHIYCMLDHHSTLSAASDRVFNYCFRVCLPSQASELRCSWTRKWNSFLSACPDTDRIYQLSYGTKHSFNAIYLVYLCLGGALQ